MKIIIGGAGAVGTHLAKLLSNEKQDIILMDEARRHIRTKGADFKPIPISNRHFTYYLLRHQIVNHSGRHPYTSPLQRYK